MPGTPMPSSQSLTPQGNRRPDAFHSVVVGRGDSRCRCAYSSARRRETRAESARLGRFFGLASKWPPVAIRTIPLWWRDDAEPGSFGAGRARRQVDLLAFVLGRCSCRSGRCTQRRLRGCDCRRTLPRGKRTFLRHGRRRRSDRHVVLGRRSTVGDRHRKRQSRMSSSTSIHSTKPWWPSAEYDRAGTHTAAQPPISLPAVAAGNQIVPARKTPGGQFAGDGRSWLGDLSSGQEPVGRGPRSVGRRSLDRGDDASLERRCRRRPGVSLEPGAKASVAFAIWDGGAKDRDGKKLVSIWQDLELERKAKSVIRLFHSRRCMRS